MPRPVSTELMSKLADALFSRTRQNVLGLLYAQPSQSFYTNEILRLTGMGVATVKRELDRMVDVGILSLTKSGNQHHYQANPYCAIYTELTSIVRKTTGIADVLEHALQPLIARIDAAFVYGPHAAHTAGAETDIDLLIVTARLKQGQLRRPLQHAEDALARLVNVTLLDPVSLEPAGLLEQLQEQPKIWIKGTENDLRKIR